MEKVRQKLSVVLTKGLARESAKDTLVKKVSLNTNLFSDSFHMDAEKRCNQKCHLVSLAVWSL